MHEALPFPVALFECVCICFVNINNKELRVLTVLWVLFDGKEKLKCWALTVLWDLFDGREELECVFF